jgi:Fe-S-cluster-containing hydrogenase component 2
MIRKIIKIDEGKCSGCGLCAEACHEGAIAMVNGKAKLTREEYCDGLGNCLPVCPTGAITFEEREAPAFSQDDLNPAAKPVIVSLDHHEGGRHACPGTQLRGTRQWPIQIRLVPVKAPFFDNADLLIAADCTAFAYPLFHQELKNGKAILIGCPKLDDTDYSEKLAEIIRANNVKSITVARMEVPCCGGLERAAAVALENSGKDLPFKVITVSIEGNILES